METQANNVRKSRGEPEPPRQARGYRPNRARSALGASAWRLAAVLVVATVGFLAITAIGWRHSNASGPQGVVAAYLHEPTYEGRKRYLIRQAGLDFAMADRYNGKAEHTAVEWKFLEELKISAGHVAVFGDVGGHSACYFLTDSGAGYKIDWPASVAYNRLGWAAIRATRPTSPVRLRCFAQLADYYNYEFRSQEKFYSIRLSESTSFQPSGSLHGYAQRSLPMGPELFECLKDGKMHYVVIDVAYIPTAVSGKDQTDCVMITGVAGLDTLSGPIEPGPIPESLKGLFP